MNLKNNNIVGHKIWDLSPRLWR